VNVFMAAVFSNGYMPGQTRYEKLNDREKGICATLPFILESFHYVGKQKYVDEMRNFGAKVFLDSGAFSAFTLGVSISVAEYCDYIKRNSDILRVENGISMASVLDGIGDPLQTWRNQLEMEARGVRPLPCFHAGEDEKYLDYYVKNYEYITLGGMVGTSTKQLKIWLDRVWSKHLLDGSGRAKIKVHGFGITAVPIMEDYPWHSCDSSSWIQSAAFGNIIMPGYSRKNIALPISVSDKSPSRHDAGQHVSTLTSSEQDYVLSLLERDGFTYERLSTVYESRAAYNLWSFGVVNCMINAANSEKFKARVQELF
jgi:hypothetical protein